MTLTNWSCQCYPEQMFHRRPKPKPPPREPKPCRDCGKPGEYWVDVFGMPSQEWRCTACHEKACASLIREESFVRYGK